MPGVARSEPSIGLAKTIENVLKEYSKASPMIPGKYRKDLKSRLMLIWGLEPADNLSRQTVWRSRRIREVYSKVQNTSQHLLCLSVLAISPTACYAPNFLETADKFLLSSNAEKFKLTLRAD